jgi:hypothetical protein
VDKPDAPIFFPAGGGKRLSPDMSDLIRLLSETNQSLRTPGDKPICPFKEDE